MRDGLRQTSSSDLSSVEGAEIERVSAFHILGGDNSWESLTVRSVLIDEFHFDLLPRSLLPTAYIHHVRYVSPLHKLLVPILLTSETVKEQLASLAARKETAQAHPGQSNTLVQPSKLAKNKRLPATMITPAGKIETSKKMKTGKHESSKKKKRSEAGKEKALERMERMDVKVKRGEEKQVSRARMDGGFGSALVLSAALCDP
jgi:hypothetical protein